MTVVKLSTRQLPDLLSWVIHHLPHSFKLYSGLKTHLGGSFPDLQFFVDSWPLPKAALAIVDPDGKELKCKDYFRHSVEGVYGVEEEAVYTLLTHPLVLDWDTRNYFRLVPSSLRSVLTRVAQDKGREASFDSNLLLKAVAPYPPPLPLPDHLVCRPISSDDADIATVAASWTYARGDPAPYLSHLVRHFPSSCVTTRRGRMVGYALGRSCNHLGLLHVVSEFRGQGLGKAILSGLTARCLQGQQQGEVCVVTEEDNRASVRASLSVGFREAAPHLRLNCMTCKPAIPRS